MASIPAAAKEQQLAQSSAHYTVISLVYHILFVNNIFWGNPLQAVILINIICQWDQQFVGHRLRSSLMYWHPYL